MDFTPDTYTRLLDTFHKVGYQFLTPGDWFSPAKPEGRIVVLRHDIDRKPDRAVRMAMIEARLGIRAGYHFRYRDFKNNPEIILRIYKLGHEIGYHYEELAHCHGNIKKASSNFRNNLEFARSIVPINTLAMHGSPLSKHDNRKLWEALDYRALGISGEVYLDFDFHEVFYLTDTGQKWNDRVANLRDRVMQKWDLSFSSTHALMQSLANNELPSLILLNIHPNRWNPPGIVWLWEFFWQMFKNLLKRGLKKFRKRHGQDGVMLNNSNNKAV